MKIEYKNPEWIENRINELEHQLLDIQNEYLINIEKASVIIPHHKMNFEDDHRVKVIQKQIAYYNMVSAPTIILIPENEEDKARLVELFNNENNL